MGKNSKIEWTEHTFNPWRGCTKVSAGCKHCYAEAMSARNPKTLGIWGVGGTRAIAAESYWRQPLAWNRAAAETGKRYRVFCASLADVFEGPDTMPNEAWPAVNAARDRLFDTIDLTKNLDWLLVTKRPQNIRRLWKGGRRENVWLLTSVEDQAAADERIPELLKCVDLAPVLGLSVEPMLGPIDLSHKSCHPYRPAFGLWRDYPLTHKDRFPLGPETKVLIDPLTGGRIYKSDYPNLINWVICGGESGPKARPMHPDWARSLRDQCQAAGVPFFFKQWGEWVPQVQAHPDALTERSAESAMYLSRDGAVRDANYGARCGSVTIQRVGKKKAGRRLDGREWNEYPQIEDSGA